MSEYDQTPKGDATILQLRVEPQHAEQPALGAGGDGGGSVVPVVFPGTADEPGGRREIIPEQWQRANFRATIARNADLLGYRARYHGVRLPVHTVRFAVYSVRGACRLTARLVTWWHCPALWHLESQAVAAGRIGHADAMRAHVEGKKTRSARGQILAVAVIAAVAGIVAGVRYVPPQGWALLAAAAFVVLIYHGKPKGQPLVDAAVLPSHHEKLTQGEVVTALGHLGIGEMNRWMRDGREIPMWIGRDGPGWRADVDMPRGVTAGQIMEKREELASALHRNVGRVWPSRGSDGDHAGKLILYVSDHPMSKSRQPAWPLAKAGRASMFASLPYGTDQRGKTVTITLMFESMLIGAIPRQGKTASLRVIVLAAALDPSCEMHVFDLKGTGDLSASEKAAHRYGCGTDDETLARCMESIREVHSYLTARAKTIAGLPSAECPERKVTPELSAKRSLHLHPLLLAIDEIQELFESDYAKEAEALLVAILKRGPAMGIMLVMATQRPDAKSLPKRISSMAGMRFCLRIVDEPSNNMILGAGMYAAGYRATMFTASDKGVGWLAGHSDEPQITRTFFLDAVAADKIGARAVAVRKAAGLLTGEAADAPVEDVSLLRDVLDVMSEAELWLDTLAQRLAELRPQLYEGWTAPQLGSALRKTGVVPVQQWNGQEQKNRNGIVRAAVLSALEGRSDA